MLQLICVILGGYVAFVLDTSALPALHGGIWTPHMVPWGLVLLARCLGPHAAMLAAAFWGLVSDCLAGGTIGIDVVCFALGTWGAQILLGTTSDRSRIAIGFAAGLTALLLAVGTSAARQSIAGEPIVWQLLIVPALAASLSTGALAAATSLLSSVLFRSSVVDLAHSEAREAGNRWRMLTE